MTDDLDRIKRALGDRYALERELGAGGMATVYLARDLKQDRTVAVKVLRPDLAGSITAARFLREIQITSSLSHPNIVPLFDSGETDGYVYFVMPHQEGRSLADRLRTEGQLPVGQAVRIACEIGEALAHAHRHGVVHRDVKPSNVLLSEGHAMVGDFGIARAVQTSVAGALTLSGVSVGTPAYMSPEQAAGDHHVDERSDVYSLGCVLYEMLAGQPPFTGSTSVALVAQHLNQAPPPLRTVRPAVSEALQAVVETALEKLPADRFPTAEAFVQALNAAQIGTTRTPTDPSTYTPTLERARPAAGDARSRRVGLVARLGAVTAVAALSLFAVYIWTRPPIEGLARNKVVVFPLVDRGGEAEDGADVALVLGMALEHTDPLKWIDGWSLLDPAVRADPSRLAPAAARALARGRQAAFYLSGTVLHLRDSVSVTLLLHDTQGDSIVDRATRTGRAGTAAPDRLGLQAVVALLPALVDPTRSADVAYLMDRDPAAVAIWIQGEREYRQANFAAALELFNRAVAADSLLVLAALKGAQAAGWATHEPELGEELVRAALEHEEYLPPRHRALARGLLAYVEGRADDAVADLRKALSDDPDWSEAWTLLGETYYHLIPSDAVRDSTARAAFREARARDPRFGPPLIHLTEIAIVEGDREALDELLGPFQELKLDAGQRMRIRVMEDCVRRGPDAVDWPAAIRLDPTEVLSAGTQFAGAGRHMACAETAFRSILARQEGVEPAVRYGATLGLEAVLAATDRDDEAGALIESTIPWAGAGVARLYEVHAAAGADFGGRGRMAVERLRESLGDRFPGTSWRTLWALGSWYFVQGDTTGLARVANALAKQRGSDAQAARVDSLVRARLLVIRGDTTQALAILQAVRPAATRRTLAWDEQEALPAERLLQARLLLASGRPAEALRVACVFDHPWPITYVAFLPASLELRREAARELGRDDLATSFTGRLEALHRAAVSPH